MNTLTRCRDCGEIISETKPLRGKRAPTLCDGCAMETPFIYEEPLMALSDKHLVYYRILTRFMD